MRCQGAWNGGAPYLTLQYSVWEKPVRVLGGPNHGGRECVEILDPKRMGRASWIVREGSVG